MFEKLFGIDKLEKDLASLAKTVEIKDTIIKTLKEDNDKLKVPVIGSTKSAIARSFRASQKPETYFAEFLGSKDKLEALASHYDKHKNEIEDIGLNGLNNFLKSGEVDSKEYKAFLKGVECIIGFYANCYGATQIDISQEEKGLTNNETNA